MVGGIAELRKGIANELDARTHAHTSLICYPFPLTRQHPQ